MLLLIPIFCLASLTVLESIKSPDTVIDLTKREGLISGGYLLVAESVA